MTEEITVNTKGAEYFSLQTYQIYSKNPLNKVILIELLERISIPMSKSSKSNKNNSNTNPLPKSSAKKVSPKFKHRKPSSYPRVNQWQLHGCTETLSKLTEEEKTYYLAFLESFYGGNESEDFLFDKESVKESRANHYANRSDVMNTSKTVQLEKYVVGSYKKKIDVPEFPTALQQREVLHPDLVQESNVNSEEDKAIEQLDLNYFGPKVLATRKTKKQLTLEKKERIKKRKNTK